MIYMVLGFVNIKELQKSHPKKWMVGMVGMERESDSIWHSKKANGKQNGNGKSNTSNTLKKRIHKIQHHKKGGWVLHKMHILLKTPF